MLKQIQLYSNAYEWVVKHVQLCSYADEWVQQEQGMGWQVAAVTAVTHFCTAAVQHQCCPRSDVEQYSWPAGERYKPPQLKCCL
jgi:hypothetical protein